MGRQVAVDMSADASDVKHARSPSPDVKSTAVVKYTAVKCPLGFSKLQCDTDLKRPPSNWLSSATDSYGLRHALSHSAGFSSFRLAHMFLDCVGEVDVVAGAECIKSLLKLPYDPTATVSIIVHRVENSLLLDQFDIHQNHMKSDWSWMKTFFYENFLKFISSEERVLYLKNKSRWALQQKSLVSKFLYHSLPSPKTNDIMEDFNKDLQVPKGSLPGPSLPEPDVQKAIPHPSFSDHTYNRNVVWTFEDIQMLIGTDMPIFGGVDRPCVSLRLQDASEPINVLTGIDYWLDNLMCNVPEVIMCYHLDGMVRKYEPIKTEELPNLQDSKFSPKVIRNVAQNILSFLKSNATKAGHTYWLFKGPNDDFVKLYDLSTLCGTTDNSTDQNPFTIPVAMLLYRVARNMKAPCQAGHIKMLLENCIKLLPENKYPHIVASSHFMIANLYVPASTDPGSPNMKVSATGECECGDPKTCRRREGFEDDATTSNMEYNKKPKSEDKKKFSNMVNSSKNKSDNKDSKNKSKQTKKEKLVSGDVAVHSLSAPRNPLLMPTEPPPMISDKLEDRCLFAIKHVTQGLSSLKYFKVYSNKNSDDKSTADATNNEDILKEEGNPQMAKPFEPIPMGYESIESKDKSKMAHPDIPIPMPYKTEQKSEIKEEESKSANRSSRRRKRDAKNKIKALSAAQATEMEQLKKKIDGIILKKDTPMPTWQEPNTGDDDNTWKIHIKSLLYGKACLACATLAEQYYNDNQFGSSLKYIRVAQNCQRILNIMLSCSGGVEDCFLLGRAGDIYFQFAKNWTRFESFFITQYNTISEDEKYILEEICNDIKSFQIENEKSKDTKFYDVSLPVDLDKSIMSSEECYSKALKLARKDRREELLRRIGSVKNEIGVKYMYEAQEQYNIYCLLHDDEENRPQLKEMYESLSKKAQNYLEESSGIFESINDIPNLALLHCNLGRFRRFQAHCDTTIHSLRQRSMYCKAITHYMDALNLLEKENNNSIKDLVLWELSSAHYTRACLLQDAPPKHSDASDEAIMALQIALQHCPLNEGPRQCLYQFRAGLLYHRLGSLYHNKYRECGLEGQKLKDIADLSKFHYEQAARIFLPLEDASMFLTVQIEHMALVESQAYSKPTLKLKIFQTAYEMLLKCEPAFKMIFEKEIPGVESKDEKEIEKQDKIDEKTTSDKSDDHEIGINPSTLSDEVLKEFKLLLLFEDRMQFLLKHIIQFCLLKTNTWKKENDVLIKYYKRSYGLFLKQEKFTDNEGKAYAKYLYDKLVEMKSYPRI